MKKIIFVLVACLMYSILPVDTYCQKNTTKIQKQSDVITITFCELVKNPERYIDSKIKMSVIYQSSFAGWTLLSDSQCEQVLFPQIAATDAKMQADVQQEIEEKLLEEDDGATRIGRISIIGEIKKTGKKLNYPIKGLLQNYYFSIDSIARFGKQCKGLSE